MHALHELLESSGILSYLRTRSSEQAPCYLVGGALRDAVLGADLETDFDFAFPGDPSAFAREFATSFAGTWFMLDAERQQSRVVFDHGIGRITCDFVPFRAPTLDEDLRKRDFTVNAIAWPCHEPLEIDRMFDPLGGVRDCHKRLLRACNARTFIDDPLRTLKGVRHATTLNFDFEPTTLTLLRESVPRIDQAAPERLRAELAKILAAENAWRGVTLLNQTGLLQEIFGQPAQKTGAEAALGYMQRLDRLLHQLSPERHAGILAQLDEISEEFLDLRSLLKFAAFCRGYRPIALKNVLRALRFSNRSVDFLTLGQQLELDRLIPELDALPASPRARARWLNGLGREPLLLFLLLALHLPEDRDPLPLVEAFAIPYLALSENGRLPDLLDGDWLRTTYHLPEGPVVGKLLESLRQAELRGEISTPQEARRWLHDQQKLIDNILLENL